MSTNPLRLKQLLDKYLSNSITGEELKEFWSLMSSLSENDLIDLEIRKSWKGEFPENTFSVDWERVYHRIQGKIANHDNSYPQLVQPRWVTMRPYLVAASVVLFIVVSFLFIENYSSSKKISPSLVENASFDLQVIRLPDGTAVTLNHNSKLDYPAAFDRGTREVYLTGEAFFDVKHNPSKPFIVHTGNLVTRVLGTAFNIKAYSDDQDIEVTVSRGKVQVQKTNTPNVLGLLSAGDQLTFNKGSENVSTARINVKDVVSWKTKDLYFDNKTFDEAAVIIGNYFGTEVRFETEALRNCRFTANFNGADDITEVMEVISVLTGAVWKKDEHGSISISGKGCN